MFTVKTNKPKQPIMRKLYMLLLAATLAGCSAEKFETGANSYGTKHVRYMRCSGLRFTSQKSYGGR
jgi:hypothetical protein